MSNEPPTFEQGILCAAAWLINAHGEDSLAAEMVIHTGVNIDNADEYDLEYLERIRECVRR